MIKSHKELLIWQKGILLVSHVYRLTEQFPKREVYGLTDQIRRSAVSIPSNIAEGFGRNSKPEMARFVEIAQGSLFELDTQLTIANDLKYLPKEDFEVLSGLISELGAMVHSFCYNLRHPKPKPLNSNPTNE